MEAASRRAERESQRRYRQLLRGEKQRAQMEARQQAAYEAELFENQIERLISVHKESPEVWDWSSIYNTPPPAPPERSSVHEVRAATVLNAFRPGFLDKLLGRAESKRQVLAQALEAAKAQDEQEYQRVYQDYLLRHTEWDERRQLAWRIMQGDTQAYMDALEDFKPFTDLSELGASFDLKPHSAQLVELRLAAEGERLIPGQIKSVASTGKLSVKPMPKAQFNEIYRSFVCGVALRAGRELFAFLPVQIVLVNIQANLLNTRTGHQGIETILSVAMSRTVFAQLNFDRLDPSDAMENFPCRMDFKKTTGFGPVDPLEGEDVSERPTPQDADLLRRSLPEAVPQVATGNAVERLLSNHAREDDCHWIPAGAAASLVGARDATKLTIGVCRRIGDAIQEAGYCIEPDARWGGGSYDWNQVVGIFTPAAGESVNPSPAYSGAANLLRLCVLVAAADGSVDKQELGVFRQVIENQLHFSKTELKRLAVLERLLTGDAGAASKALAKVAKAVPVDKRLLVGQVLVRVAAVDHVITRSEYRALERVFKTFELPTQALADLMLEVCPSPEEVRIQEAGEGSLGEAIPNRAVQGQPQAFCLDMAKVCAIANETKEVVGILSVVMEGEKEEALPPATTTGPAPRKVAEVSEPPRETGPAAPARFSGLDPALQPVLERLLAKDSWPRRDFQALASEFHLMPLSIHDVINEWADQSLGDYLLEGEDPIVIRRELVPKENT